MYKLRNREADTLEPRVTQAEAELGTADALGDAEPATLAASEGNRDPQFQNEGWNAYNELDRSNKLYFPGGKEGGGYTKHMYNFLRQGDGKDILPSAGGLYAISTPMVTPNPAGRENNRVKVGVANHYHTRLAPYETTLPDGYNVHYLMPLPTDTGGEKEDYVFGGQRNLRTEKLKKEKMLKDYLDGTLCNQTGEEGACEAAETVMPVNNGHEWFQHRDPAGSKEEVLEQVRKGMKYVYDNIKDPAALLRCTQNGDEVSCDPMEEGYGARSGEIAPAYTSPMNLRERAGRGVNRYGDMTNYSGLRPRDKQEIERQSRPQQVTYTGQAVRRSSRTRSQSLNQQY